MKLTDEKIEQALKQGKSAKRKSWTAGDMVAVDVVKDRGGYMIKLWLRDILADDWVIVE